VIPIPTQANFAAKIFVEEYRENFQTVRPFVGFGKRTGPEDPILVVCPRVSALESTTFTFVVL